MTTTSYPSEQATAETKTEFLVESRGIKESGTRTSATIWNWGDADSGSRHGYYMLKEILEQPQAIRNATIQDKESFTEIAMDILRAKKVLITGCGSSRYAGLVGGHLFSQIARKSSDIVMAPDIYYFPDSVDSQTVVIAVSQSGETPDVIEGVNMAREHGARVVSIVNGKESTLGRISDRVIDINSGPEMGAAATKSFTSQLTIFYLLAYAMMNQYEAAVRKLESLSSEIDRAITCNNGNLEKAALQLGDKGNCYYMARGVNFPVASEGALKLRQSAFVHAEGIHAGELKHGPLALVEEGTSTVVVCPKDYTYSDTMNNAIEAKSRGAYIIGVSDEPNDIYDCWIRIPTVEEVFYPLITVIPLQLIAYRLATNKRWASMNPGALAEYTSEIHLSGTTVCSPLTCDQISTSAGEAAPRAGMAVSTGP